MGPIHQALLDLSLLARSRRSRDRRFAEIVLPTATGIDHNVTLIALVPVASLDGRTLRWIDPITPDAHSLYAKLPAIGLGDGQHMRLFPGLSEAAATDDALVYAGGPGTDPPIAGAIIRLLDPSGRVAHETAALRPTSGIASQAIVPIPDTDGTRAILLPVDSSGFADGWWTLTLSAKSEGGPDLPRWSQAGKPANESISLAFGIPA